MKIFLLIGILAMGSLGAVKSPVASQPAPAPSTAVESVPEREQDKLLYFAKKYTYVWENNGPNRSKDIDIWNKYTGAPMGSPYCASYLSYMHYLAKVDGPKTAWSPSCVGRNNVKYSEIAPADLFGLYFASMGRIAHVGMFEKKSGNLFYTIEGNTSPTAESGSSKDRDGGVVCRKTRSAYLMSNSKNKFSRYWKN